MPKKKGSENKLGKQKVKIPKVSLKNIPTLQLKKETDIAMDFALKVYKIFDKISFLFYKITSTNLN